MGRLLDPLEDGWRGHAQSLGGLAGRDFLPLPLLTECLVAFRLLHRLSAELHAPRPCCRQSLHRALMVHGALRFGNVREHLDDEVGDEFRREVVAVLVARVQEGQVDDYDGGSLLTCDDVELLNHLVVAASETVEAFHDQGVALREPRHECIVGGTVKVLAALLVHNDILAGMSNSSNAAHWRSSLWEMVDTRM